MQLDLIFLIIESMAAYGLVLAAHGLRHRWGLSPFYSLMGCLTAVMSIVTDSGAAVQIHGLTFLVGSTVYYSALLVGVLVVYAFDGPQATQRTIFIIIAASVLAPLAVAGAHLLAHFDGQSPLKDLPRPDLRINLASVLTSFLDFIFLAVAWEAFNRAKFFGLAARTGLIILGVMLLDGLLFTAGAFLGLPDYTSIARAAITTRVVAAAAVAPVLWGYMQYQFSKPGVVIVNRPMLAILQRMSEMERELSVAHNEILRRIEAEKELRASEERLAGAIEASGAAVYEVNLGPEPRLYVSERWSAMLGYDSANLREPRSSFQFWLKILHPSDREMVKSAWMDFVVGRIEKLDLEFRARRTDGRWAFVHEMARVVDRSDDGRPTRIVGVQLDISERKLAEKQREQLIDELEQSHESLLTLSRRDALTGVANRRAFDEELPGYWHKARSSGQPLSAIMADIDFFKNYNDTHGHLAGDECLAKIAGALAKSLHRGDDLLARYGGEEFVILLPGAELEGAATVARAARKVVRELGIRHLSSPAAEIVTASFGVACSSRPGIRSATDLLAAADRALYRAKAEGRDRVCLDEPS